MCQMRTVVEAQPTPPVHTIRGISSVIHEWPLQSIQPIITSRCAIRDIPQELGIVQLVLISNIVVDRRVALVRMPDRTRSTSYCKNIGSKTSLHSVQTTDDLFW